jgi:dolichol kinase
VIARERQKSAAPTPIARRVFHLTAGCVFPVSAFIFHQRELVMAAIITFMVFMIVEAVRLLFPSIIRPVMRWVGVLLKVDEVSRPTGATYVVVGTLVAFLLFDIRVAALALLFLAFGDPAAALVGRRFGRIKIWTKSLEGSLAFFITSMVVGAVVVAAGGFAPLWIMPIGAAVAALVELAPLPVDDNLTVPTVSGGAMTLLLFAF